MIAMTSGPNRATVLLAALIRVELPLRLLLAYGAFTTMPLDLEGRVAQGMQGYDNYVKLHDVVPTITPKELSKSSLRRFWWLRETR